MAIVAMKAAYAGEDPATGVVMGKFGGVDAAAAFVRSELVSVLHAAGADVAGAGSFPESDRIRVLRQIWGQVSAFWGCYDLAPGTDRPSDGQAPANPADWLPFRASDFGLAG